MNANNSGSQGRHLERYDELVQFDLPKGYELSWEDKDDGSKVCWIRVGEYENDNGETVYHFSAWLQEIAVKSTDEDVIPEGEKPLDTIHRRSPDRRYIMVSKDPDAEIAVMEMPINILGNQLKAYVLYLIIPVSQDKVTTVMTNGVWDEDDLSKNIDLYRHFIDIVNSVRFKDNAFPRLSCSAEELMERLKPEFEGKESKIVGRVGLEVKVGNEVISDDYITGDDEGNIHFEDRNAKYTAATPPDYLYAHYGKLKREVEKLGGPNTTVVLNNGEEFQALDLLHYLEEDGQSGSDVYRKMKDAVQADDYDLDQTALLIAQVFRVSKSAFVSRHDDECDIRERLMDKKWKLSALRSFAWTLADLANKEKKSIDDYGYGELVDLCRFIEGREWLNYEEGSWFNGLCGHPDIHVYYMPGVMVDSGEAEEIYNLQNYNPIASLDAFREDLSHLKNVMIKIHNELLKNRDRSAKLDSPIAAVLQAWCVMAVSAKTPFLSEDGPMMFFHSYPEDALNASPISVGPKAAAGKKDATRTKKPAAKRKTASKPRSSAPKKKEAQAAEPASEDQDIEIDPDVLAEMTPEQAEEYKRAMQLARSIQAQLEEIKAMMGQQADMEVVKSYELVTGADGRERIKFGEYPAGSPIEWLVLERNGMEMLLLSEYGLDARNYSDSGSNEWQNCELREWLNEEFYSCAFNTAERGMILDDTHDTYKRTMSGEEPTGFVTDKVFLLSTREATRYFPSARELVCKATPYAKQNGAEIEGGPDQCHWWLRSPAVEGLGIGGWAGCIRANGQGKGWGIYSREICVRPVIRIRLTTEAVMGTFTNSAKTAPATKPAPAKKTAPKKTASTQKKPTQSKVEKPTPPPEPVSPDGYVIVGTGKKKIAQRAYKNRLDLEKVEVVEGVQQISTNAFAGCSNLKEIHLPSSLKTIGSSAFAGCSNLKEIRLPSSLKTIESSAFADCSNLKEIRLPSSLRTIERGVFSNSRIVEIVLPEGMEELTLSAFSRMNELRRVFLPDTIVKIWDWPNLSYLEHFEYISMSRAVAERAAHDDNEILALCEKIQLPGVDATEKNRILRGINDDGTLHLLDATEVQDYEFQYRNDLERIVIPNGVTRIGKSAFGSCKNLRKVVLPDSITEIEENAFYWCSNLEEITWPSGLIKIGDNAMCWCEKLRHLELPPKLRELGAGCFQLCEALTEIVIPASVEHVGEGIVSGAGVSNITFLGTPVQIDGDPFGEYKFFIDSFRIPQAFYDRYKNIGWMRKYIGYRSDAENCIYPKRIVITDPKPSAPVFTPQPAGNPGFAPAAAKVTDPNAERRRQLEAQIRSLETERDAVRGLFGGIKRKKLQNQINELQAELRRLS